MNYKHGFSPIIIALIAILAIGGGYAAYKVSRKPVILNKASDNISAPLTLDQVKNATYDLHRFDGQELGGPITLVGGKDGGASSYHSLSIWNDDEIAIGDLNGDGNADAAVVVYENTGGNGYFAYLAVLLNIDGKLKYIDSVFIDDRPEFKKINIENGNISLSMIVHGPKDGGCCPTVSKNFLYVLANGKLVKVALPPVSSMSGWKTYKNDQYGFEIKYLDSMSVRNSNNGVSLTSIDKQR